MNHPKFYGKLTFFKQAFYISIVLTISLLILGFLKTDFTYFYLFIALSLLGLGLITFRLIQFIYEFNLERKQDVNQMESWMWIYKHLTPNVALPASRDYAASPDILKIMVENFLHKTPKVIVEAGSGLSSIILSELLIANNSDALHFALDHEEKYANITRTKINNPNSKIIHAPLKNYEQHGLKWYDITSLKNVDQIDMLLIDGPPALDHQYPRYPAFPLLKEKLKKGAIIIADDTNRPEDRETVERWAKEYDCKLTWHNTEKGAAVLIKN